MIFDGLRFEYELEHHLRFCKNCGKKENEHPVKHETDSQFDCDKFVKPKLPTKWALKRAESVLENALVDDVIAIGFALDEVRKEFRSEP